MTHRPFIGVTRTVTRRTSNLLRDTDKPDTTAYTRAVYNVEETRLFIFWINVVHSEVILPAVQREEEKAPEPGPAHETLEWLEDPDIEGGIFTPGREGIYSISPRKGYYSLFYKKTAGIETFLGRASDPRILKGCAEAREA